MIWTTEYDDVLRKYFALNFSASEISSKLWIECHVNKSRNAVIGRVHRLGLNRNTKPTVIKTRSDAGKPRPATMKTATPRARIRGVETPGIPVWAAEAEPFEMQCVEVEPLVGRVAFIDLKPKQCRWPLGGWPGNDPVMFCGRPGEPYCPRHASMSVGPGSYAERWAHRVVRT